MFAKFNRVNETENRAAEQAGAELATDNSAISKGF
jgi:hypothetical protein